MIMGKRQIVLASLILILGVAIYLNWQFSGASDNLTQTVNGETSSTRHYGEAQLANADANENTQETSLLAKTKLTRKKSRDESLTQIKAVTQNAQSPTEEINKAVAKAQQLVDLTESEMQTENIIASKGFEDCVVFCENGKAQIIVKSNDLTEDQIIQIRDVVIEKLQISPSNISISVTE
ncbi:MAG: SpoIIIAH-like family protein [Oscillospiraceae bacterium]